MEDYRHYYFVIDMIDFIWSVVKCSDRTGSSYPGHCESHPGQSSGLKRHPGLYSKLFFSIQFFFFLYDTQRNFCTRPIQFNRSKGWSFVKRELYQQMYLMST